MKFNYWIFSSKNWSIYQLMGFKTRIYTDQFFFEKKFTFVRKFSKKIKINFNLERKFEIRIILILNLNLTLNLSLDLLCLTFLELRIY